MRLAVVYTLLAAVATVVNIGFQDLCIRIYHGPYAVSLSILVGTAAGLVAKYVLDKRYIFKFQAKDARHDAQTFVLYTAMGLITTVVFWGTEAAFEVAFGTKSMRYVGAVLGLVIGYILKYRLDKRFVFCQKQVAKVNPILRNPLLHAKLKPMLEMRQAAAFMARFSYARSCIELLKKNTTFKRLLHRLIRWMRASESSSENVEKKLAEMSPRARQILEKLKLKISENKAA